MQPVVDTTDTARLAACCQADALELSREDSKPPMTFARVFQSGNSQAVRRPKEFRRDADQVGILRQGNDTVRRQSPPPATAVFDLLASLPADCMADRPDDAPPQERDTF